MTQLYENDEMQLIYRFGVKPTPIAPNLAVQDPKMIQPEPVLPPVYKAADSEIGIPKKYVIIARLASSGSITNKTVDLTQYNNFEYLTIWVSSGTLSDVFTLNDVAGVALAFANGANPKATVPMLREIVSVRTPATAGLTCLVIAHSRSELA